MDNPDNPTSVVLSDEQLLDYLDFIEQKTYDYIDSLNDEIIKGGFLAVCTFFVLSGYLKYAPVEATFEESAERPIMRLSA